MVQALCKKCNEITGKGMCSKCGELNSFRVKESSKSILFLLGCILITLCDFGGIFVDRSWLTILDLAFSLVYITALWMLIIEARMMGSSMALKALFLFKISAVFSLIFLCISFGIIAIGILLGFFRGITFLLLIGFVGGIAYVIIKYYFLALLKVLDGVRMRITRSEDEPLDGLDSFLIISYIGIAISTVLAFVNWDGINNLELIFTITGNFGLFLCLHVLKRFSEAQISS